MIQIAGCDPERQSTPDGRRKYNLQIIQVTIAVLRLKLRAGLAFLPKKTQSDKNVQPAF